MALEDSKEGNVKRASLREEKGDEEIKRKRDKYYLQLYEWHHQHHRPLTMKDEQHSLLLQHFSILLYLLSLDLSKVIKTNE